MSVVIMVLFYLHLHFNTIWPRIDLALNIDRLIRIGFSEGKMFSYVKAHLNSSTALAFADDETRSVLKLTE